jgi:Flp pilus assembly protein TadB
VKRTSSGPPARWAGVLVAAVAAAGLVAFATQAVSAQAGVPKKATWKTTSPAAEWTNSGFTLANNVLTAQAGPQTIWAYSYRRWGVQSEQPATSTVKSYPSVKWSVASQPAYSSLKYLRSTFAQSMPSTPALTADAAYEVWLNNHTVDVMMWVDNRNRTPAGQRIGEIVIYQHDFVVWRTSPDVYTFVLSGPQEPYGRVHLLSALRWLVNHNRLSSSDTVSEVDFGWEIVSTGGVRADFGISHYGVSSGFKRLTTSKQVTGIGLGQWWALAGGVGAVFAALFVLAMLIMGRINRAGRHRTLAGMFDKYGPRREPLPAKAEPEDSGKVATTAVGAVDRLMPPGAQDRLARRLDLAGVARKPAEWALLGTCIGIVIAAVLSLVTSYILIGVLAGAVIGWLTMRMSLSVRILRRRASFSDQLPDILQLIASTLQAGFSLPQALDSVVREQGQPAAGEFSRALAESRLGARLEDSLEAVATRMDSDDLHWTVMAVRIQQGVGGNLAEVLMTIANTIRERAAMRRQVRALSAEGRLSAYILVALPLIVATWLFISSATYMRPLYTTTPGEVLLVFATALVVIGALWMHRVIKVDV